jgi:ABC-type transport system involved in cytochrome c biogenesis permease subunit
MQKTRVMATGISQLLQCYVQAYSFIVQYMYLIYYIIYSQHSRNLRYKATKNGWIKLPLHSEWQSGWKAENKSLLWFNGKDWFTILALYYIFLLFFPERCSLSGFYYMLMLHVATNLLQLHTFWMKNYNIFTLFIIHTCYN